MAFLLQLADSMFPEGAGRPKAVAKMGSPAKLINELILDLDAKDAVDALWRARGYLQMTCRGRACCAGCGWCFAGMGARRPQMNEHCNKIAR